MASKASDLTHDPFRCHSPWVCGATDCSTLEQARRLKKEIPLIGQNGIPLCHELELALIL
jgi:hypothetical protein